MARFDIAGMFWDETPPPKPPKKEKPKRIPPEPVWLLPTYLPGLEEARAMRLDLFTDEELVRAAGAKEQLAWDIECYPNYFLVGFKSIQSGKIIYFEMDDKNPELDLHKLHWVLHNFEVVDFNGDGYDVPVVSIALTGANTEALYWATQQLIVEQARPQDVLRAFKCKRIKLNHIDLIELVAGDGSLKLLSGRLHARRMQDLPFVPGTILTDDQIAITRWYWVNDLDNTIALRNELAPDIALRESMSQRYGMDLRSHSDAQIAETVISSEIRKITGQKYLQRPQINPESQFKYKAPHFIKYQTQLMNWVLETVEFSWFSLQANGAIQMPEVLDNLEIKIANSVYRMGVGGLHSSEKIAAHWADEDTILRDLDVGSYYPKIILNCGLTPVHLGKNFLTVFSKIVEERLGAKARGDKIVADILKIVVNGSFGKLGSKWSILYSPDLLMQVTVTGQLSLLMLIERLELAGIPVVSANTDGIVIKCPKSREQDMNAIVSQWEKDTGFEMEETRYKALLSRDVNNYFAIYEKPKGEKLADRCKVKGIFSEKGSNRNSILSKNPTNMICSDAVIAHVTTGEPLAKTIGECRDIRRFVSVRTVRGGAVKDGQYLGKAIRWYYAAGQEGEVVYARSGNKVPKSEGARPLMELPDQFPGDIDYEGYEKQAHKFLVQIGFIAGEIDSEELEEVA